MNRARLGILVVVVCLFSTFSSTNLSTFAAAFGFQQAGPQAGGVVGLPYGTTLQLNGGVGPFTYSITTGSLPAGLGLSSSPSNAPPHISGTPTATGTSNFTMMLTDSTNSTTTATFSIAISTLPASTPQQLALLSGQYAFLVRGGDDPATKITDLIASINFDGHGTFTIILDQNAEGGGNFATQCTGSGTYSVGADNRGVFLITSVATCATGSVGGGSGSPPVGTFTLGDVKNGIANTAREIDFHDNDGQHGRHVGLLRRQDSTSFNAPSFAGTYSFGFTGQDTSLGRAVEAGEVTFTDFNNVLAISGGNFDLSDNGTLLTDTISGSYTAPDANGRIVLTTNIPGVGTTTSVVYMISANEFFLMTLDPTATNLLLAGKAERQFNPNSFDLTSLKGPDLVTASGTSGNGTFALAGLATANIVNNVGNIAITSDGDDGGKLNLAQTQNGTYTVAQNGRALLTGFGPPNIVLYLIRPDRGFLIGQDPADPPFGEIEPQIGGPFSPSPLANNLFLGLEELIPNMSSAFEGVAALAPSNTLDITDDESHSSGDLIYGQTFPITYSVDPTGHVLAQTSDGSHLNGYLSSPFKMAIIDTTGPISDPSPETHPHLIILRSIAQPPGAPSPTTTNVNFAAPVPIGSNALSAPVAFGNAGVGPLAIQGVTNAADFSATGSCVAPLPVTLAPGQPCQVVVTFAPGATTPTNTTLNETITIQTDAGNITIHASGTAIAAGISFGPGTTVDYQNIPLGTSATKTLTVTNTGSVTLTISTIAEAGSFPGDFVIQTVPNTCVNGTTLTQNQNCVLQIQFTPGGLGPRSATITFTDNSPAAGSQQTVTLQGVGAGPAITLGSNQINFGGVPPTTTSAPQTVTVTNTGLSPLHIGTVSITGPDKGDFALAPSSTCPGAPPIPPNQGCTVVVTFTPPTANPFNAAVTIASDASNGTQTISLTGSGAIVSITPAPGSSTSVTVHPGDTAVFPLTLTSTGFSGTVTLGCTSPQTTITCTVNPKSVSVSGNQPIVTSISVQTFCSWMAPDGGPVSGPKGELVWTALLMLLGLALLAAAGSAKRERRLQFAFALVAIMAMVGAGCANNRKGPAGSTPPGQYTMTISATAQGVTSTINVTLNVI